MTASHSPSWRWDLYCRVIDNFGDIGVCWRLARDLCQRGHAVRLVVDDARALAWMAPTPWPAGLSVHPWVDLPLPGIGPDVVVEAFGCDPPPSHIAAWRTKAKAMPPVWINLEYLSAEPYVERSHRLASPQFSGPGQGLTKWFFYPGFTEQTGGLLREPGLARRQAASAAGELWQRWNLPVPSAGHRLVSLFCYPHAPLASVLPALMEWAQGQPVTLLSAAGGPTHLAQQALDTHHPKNLHLLPLPWMSQDEFDQVLCLSDLNLVRGEDSLVRALWAAKPMLWHIYPQDDGAHGPKLMAFLGQYLLGADPDTAHRLSSLMQRWCGLPTAPSEPAWPKPAEWLDQAQRVQERLGRQADLVTQLLVFVASKRTQTEN